VCSVCMYVRMCVCACMCVYVCVNSLYNDMYIIYNEYVMLYMQSFPQTRSFCVTDSFAKETGPLTKPTGWRRCIGCLKLQVISREESQTIGLFRGKWPKKMRHPMGLRHPVCIAFTHEPHTPCVCVCVHTHTNPTSNCSALALTHTH